MKVFGLAFLFCLFCTQVQSQTYYWVGNSGNWSDNTNWSATSGGTGGVFSNSPSLGSQVVFDANSFSASGQTVTFDVGNVSINSMKWTGANAPIFVSSSASDTINIDGTLLLNPTMTYNYAGLLFFTGGTNDTIQTAGKTLLNDIYINTFDDTLRLVDDLTSTAGIHFQRGGFFMNDRTITCAFFNSSQNTERTIGINNTTFNLFGAQNVSTPLVTLDISSSNLTRDGSGESFNLTYTGIDTVRIGLDTNVSWNKLNCLNENLHFIRNSAVDTINSTSLESIELNFNNTLVCKGFNVVGNCAGWVKLYSPHGVSKVDNDGGAWAVNQFRLKNINGIGAGTYTATNSLTSGGNSNWTITEDLATTDYYWVGGTGTFYDPSHWSLSSGGMADACVPGPNDRAFFDANSGTLDTLFLSNGIILRELNFTNIAGPTVLYGNNDVLEVRENLAGSSALKVDWNGDFLLTNRTSLSTITNNDTEWHNDFVKSGSDTIVFNDNFQTSGRFLLNDGVLDAMDNDLTFGSFICNKPANARSIDFTNSTIEITGAIFHVDSLNMTQFAITPSTIEFTDTLGLAVEFVTGGYDYDTIVISTGSVDVSAQAAHYELLQVNPGATLILDNFSNHTYDSLSAIGSCDLPIILKSSNSLAPAATLTHPSNVETSVNYAIIDHLNADSFGSYFAPNSALINGSNFWIANSTISSISIDISANDTLNGGDTLMIDGTLPALPPNAIIVSSILTIDSVNTNGGTNISDCEISLTGASVLDTTYLTGDTGTISDTTLTLNTTTLPGASGTVSLFLTNDTTLHTSPFGQFILDTAYLTVNYYVPYQPTSNTYYWYGDEGDWSDLSHWSLNSGNMPDSQATCLPSTRDTVIFDNNSFSTTDQTVRVDVQSYFSVMDWSLSTNEPTLLLEQSLTASGDVTLEKDMTITRENTVSNLFFQPQEITAEFDTDSTLVQVPIVLVSDDENDTLSLVNPLVTSDSTVIIIGGGVFKTNDHNVTSGSLLIGSNSKKEIYFGSSDISLRNGFGDDSFDSSLVLDAGTSNLTIDDNDEVFENFFRSKGHTFFDVTLNFNSSQYSIFSGTNTFNDLTIGAGSKVSIADTSIQTILSDLTMVGNCRDSIHLRSTVPGQQYEFVKASGTISSECINVSDIDMSGGATFSTLFSTDINNNDGLTFSTSVSTTASITGVSNYCSGDTLTFTNASTAFSGNSTDLTYSWNFDDGFFFEGDTAQHYYENAGSYNIELISEYTNFCTDTVLVNVNILDPSVSLSANQTSVCFGDSVNLSANATPNNNLSFEYYLNGASQNTPTDSLVTYNFLPSDQDTLIVQVDTAGCIALSDTIIITVNPRPTTTLTSNDTIICSGDSITLTGSGAELYQYFKNGVAISSYIPDSIVLTDIVDNDVFLVVGKYAATDCEDTSSTITFTVNDLPSITLAQNDLDLILCEGDLVTFTVDTVGIGNYYYFENNLPIDTLTSEIWSTDSLENGSVVNAYVEDINGCFSPISNSFTYLVNSIPTPTISASSTNICSGEQITVTGAGVAQYEFVINGSPIGPASGTSFFITDTLTVDATITVNGEQSGCIGTSTPLVINVTPSPVTVLSSNVGTTICDGDTVEFTATSATATEYEFSLNNSVVSAQSTTDTYSNPNLSDNDLIEVTAFFSGCTYTTSAAITVNPSPSPNIFTNDIDNALCEGESISITGTNGSMYEFFVNGVSTAGPATSTVYTTSSLPAGVNNIYVSVENGFGCIDSSAIIPVTVTATPIVSLTSVQGSTVCSGTQVDFESSPSATDYQFFVNGVSQGLPSSSTTFSSNALFDGDTISLIGYNGICSNPSIDTIFLSVDPSPNAGLTGTLTYCQNTSEIFTATGGTFYEFFVDGNSQGASSNADTFDGTSIPSGNHTISVTAQNGNCSDDAILNITVLSNPTIGITGNATACEGESIVLTGSGAQLFEFFINGTSQGASINNTLTSTSIVNGDVITLTGESPGGCVSQNTASITMSILPTPTVTLLDDDGDLSLCQNQSVLFTASGANNYEFFINGFSQGASSPTNTFTSNSISNGQSVTVIGESNGCFNSPQALNYSVFGYPIVDLTNNSDTTLCTGELTDLSASGASEYLFYINGVPQGVLSPTSTFTSLLANNDVVTVEGSTNNCATTASEAIQFSVFTFPTVMLSSSDADNEICAGESVTFTGTGAMSYEFLINGATQPSIANTLTTTELNDGETITLIGSNADCSTAAPQSLTFIVNEMDLFMTSTPQNLMLCEGEALTVDASGADEYELFVNGVSQGAQSATSTFVLNNLAMGDYVTLNGYSTATGCVQLENETIYPHVFDAPAIDVNGNTTLCEGDSTLLVSSEEHGLQWFIDGSPILGAMDTTYTVFDSGDYSLEITNGGSGEIWSVGYNANGEFGDGTNFDAESPSETVTISDVSEIKSRQNHTIALLNTGEVYGWGNNASGQLGDGTYTASNVPNLITGIPVATSIAAGGNFSVIVSTNGDAFVWGENNEGQLGLSNTTTFNSPQLIVGLNDLSSAATGIHHTVLLRNDGTVWTAGNNDFGQLGNGTNTSSTSFIQVPGLTNIETIETGDFHTMAIDSNNNLYVWGNNGQGQLGLNDIVSRLDPTLSSLRDVSEIDGGNAHTIMRTIDGSAYATGSNNFGQLATGDFIDRQLPTLIDIDAVSEISSGAYHSVFHKNDNSVWAAGRNDNYQLGNLTPGSIATISRMTEVEGVIGIEAGLETTHFIYGATNSCISPVTNVNVQTAPQPIITLNGTTLSSSETGVSYQWYINGVEILNTNTDNITPNEDGYYTVLVTYANGCSSESEPFPYGQVSVSDITSTIYRVYPNPTSGELTIDWDGSQTIRTIKVLDVLGRVVAQKSNLNSSSIQFDLSDLARGNYNIQIIQPDATLETIRIIKR